LFLKHYNKSELFPIVVIPNEGPLKLALEAMGIKVIIAPVLKLYRGMFSFKNGMLFFKSFKESCNIIDSITQQYKIDLIYSNTLAVLFGYFYARKRRIKHLWHVHEIVASPKIVTFLFKMFLKSKHTHKIIFNSKATLNFWSHNSKKIVKKSIVIHNAVGSKNQIEIDSKSDKFKIFEVKNDCLVIGLVGRISRLKGQQLLLHAFRRLVDRFPNLLLVYIGSTPPNQDHFLTDLKLKISAYQLQEKVKIYPFQEDIWKFWNAIDIAVVPSTEPESFGLVALEAMLSKKPVIASNHGGITDVVVHQETGLLFEPASVERLEEALTTLIENSEKRIRYGEKGYERALKEFSIQTYVSKISKTITELY
jgi:glycosyltransferase involved in cell wall biosynthesis